MNVWVLFSWSEQRNLSPPAVFFFSPSPLREIVFCFGSEFSGQHPCSVALREQRNLRMLWVLSIMPKNPEISVGIQMERFISVSSDRNIRDHLWRWTIKLLEVEHSDQNSLFHLWQTGSLPQLGNSGKEFKMTTAISISWPDLIGKCRSTSFSGSLILLPPRASEERPWHTLVTCLPESGRWQLNCWRDGWPSRYFVCT